MNRIIELWQSATQIDGANWVIGIAGALIVGLVGYYVVMSLRGMATGLENESGDLLTDFQQLKATGKLTAEEFNRVKASTPLEGVTAELMQRPSPAALSKGENSAPADEPVLPPPRKLTPEELATIQEKMALRQQSGEAIVDATADKDGDQDG